MANSTDDPIAVISRIHDALNRHDLDSFVDCFSVDYDSEQPAHPDRHFRGRPQVRKNWSAMLEGLPDFRSELLRVVAQGDTVWAEWRWTGTRAKAAPLDVRGVTLFGVHQGRVAWGRLYMEEVDAGQGIAAVVASLAGQPAPN